VSSNFGKYKLFGSAIPYLVQFPLSKIRLVSHAKNKSDRIFSTFFNREDSRGLAYCFNPHSARNGSPKTIKEQLQGEDSSVGKQERRNLRYGGEEETN